MCVPYLRECIYRTRGYVLTMGQALVNVGAYTEREGVFLDGSPATIFSAVVWYLLEMNLLTIICRLHLAGCLYPETILAP